jgi:hypothetical protein
VRTAEHNKHDTAVIICILYILFYIYISITTKLMTDSIFLYKINKNDCNHCLLQKQFKKLFFFYCFKKKQMQIFKN